jgi:hypothetical protein
VKKEGGGAKKTLKQTSSLKVLFNSMVFFLMAKQKKSASTVWVKE